MAAPLPGDKSALCPRLGVYGLPRTRDSTREVPVFFRFRAQIFKLEVLYANMSPVARPADGGWDAV